ncbi:MAG TPA: HAMP domain-containing sensor histidine kinase [Clostridia bacterium]|nr:HAMP domain-containing sensor histidine kinase [Clostridia bacterium]
MIKKLSNRIFLLIMVSLSIIVIGTISVFTILNYNNTINSTTFMMDRFIDGGPKVNPKTRFENRSKQENNINGLYTFVIENSEIIAVSNTIEDKTINEYANKISKSKSKKGIIGDYIYKTRDINENTKIVSLMENKNTILHIKIVFIISGALLIISLISIYIIAKKVSKIIVNPVEQTFEKQKQFISDASHELKTPLSVIEANADVLENEIGNNKWIKYIQNEVNSMDKLVNELLLLAKTENVEEIKEQEKLNLSNQVEIILSMFESMAYEKRVCIKSNVAKNIFLNCNKQDIEHIVSNLIDNSIKHSNYKKEVVVNLIKEKNEIILDVKNTGDPIPEEEKEKIFERFYRGDKSRNRNEKRYGLGLAIVKSIVEKYNGKITVLYKDNFTIFRIVLPN